MVVKDYTTSPHKPHDHRMYSSISQNLHASQNLHNSQSLHSSQNMHASVTGQLNLNSGGSLGGLGRQSPPADEKNTGYYSSSPPHFQR